MSLPDHRREWLITNGLGGYASGLVNGGRSRRYHGLLVAATKPPVERRMLVLGCEEILEVGGQIFNLSQMKPDYFNWGRDSVPRWIYITPFGSVGKHIAMRVNENTVAIGWFINFEKSFLFRVRPLYANRDHHELGGTDAPSAYVYTNPQVEPLSLTDAPAQTFDLLTEQERGFDHLESVTPIHEYRFENLSPYMVFSTEADFEVQEQKYWIFYEHSEDVFDLNRIVINAFPKSKTVDDLIPLVRAADQFIVKRKLDDGADGLTIVAGYPWFTDWGRDTMIALPGLCIATGRYDDAELILKTFARYVDEGMLPNTFPDAGEKPMYNTVDAALWFFEAVRALHTARPKPEVLTYLYPILKDIVGWHVRGTRYNIKIDPADGLLYAGADGANLTWMDAKVEGVVITPRTGKAVEINALWINATRIMADFARGLNDSADAEYFTGLADKACAGFSKFWYEEKDVESHYLYDVIDRPDGTPDKTIRPNQVIAAALPHTPLTKMQLWEIYSVCEFHLLTPYGLRSLSKKHPDYRGIFLGDWRTRDSMYHQGTVWGWLIGSWVQLYLRVFATSPTVKQEAQRLLQPLIDHMLHDNVGSMAEIFDGDAPHLPRGAWAQAWTVGEVLRLWKMTEE